MPNIMHYDQEKDRLWFDHNKSNMCTPFSRGRNGASFTLACSARYPVSLIGYRRFLALYPDGELSPEAREVIDAAGAVPDAIKEERYVRRFDGLFRVPPFQHQREVIEMMMYYPKLAILLEQGLGKTFISINALAMLRELNGPEKTIVICPHIVFQSWIDEVEKYSSLRIAPYLGGPEQRRAQREVVAAGEWDILLTTFDMLTDRRASPKKRACGMSNDELWEAWWMMGDMRDFYLESWRKDDLLDSREEAALRGDATKAAKLKILAKIPQNAFPRSVVREAQDAASNEMFFKRLGFDNIIIDEASRCLNPESQRSQAIDTLAARAGRVYLLSGTLCVGRPTDFFMPMHILDPAMLGMKFDRFKQLFCVFSAHNPHMITGYKNLDILKLYIQPHIIERSRSECIDLPKRTIVRRYYTPSDAAIDVLEHIRTNDTIRIGGKVIGAEQPVVKIARAMQVLNGFLYVGEDNDACNSCGHVVSCVSEGIHPGGKGCTKQVARRTDREVHVFKENPKLALLEEDLSDSRPEEKIIIWAWYRQDIKVIAEMLTKKGIGFVTPETKDCTRRFNTDDSIRVFLGQTVQGIGITLNTATCTIYYSHGMSLEPRLQSMDRNYRIGQAKPVIVKDYVAKGTVEENVVELLEHKKDVKEFMQKDICCPTCEHCMLCLKEGIEYLKKGCVHFGERKNAETKKGVWL